MNLWALLNLFDFFSLNSPYCVPGSIRFRWVKVPLDSRPRVNIQQVGVMPHWPKRWSPAVMTGHCASPSMKCHPLAVLARHTPTNTDSLHLTCLHGLDDLLATSAGLPCLGNFSISPGKSYFATILFQPGSSVP